MLQEIHRHAARHGLSGQQEMKMSKGYWLAIYRAIHDEDQLAAYAKKATSAIAAGGGTFLSRGMPVEMLEGSQATRTVLIEFPSAQAAIDTYNSDAYADALATLGDAADRDIRVLDAL
jgi:uncharacterized protein (DUF1330 family)